MNTEYNNIQNNSDAYPQMNMQQNMQQTQYVQDNQSQNIYNDSSFDNGGAKGSKKILIIIGLVILIAAVAILVMFIFKGKNNSNEDMFSDGTSFFLRNEEGNYALFNDKGKQLTEFIFTEVADFNNHVAVVSNSDGNQGIIRADGKYIVKLGDNVIGNYGPFFELYGESKFIDSNGKTILEGEEWEKATTGYTNEHIFLFDNDNEIKVMHYNGTVLDTIVMIDSEEDPSELLSWVANRIQEYGDNYATFYYNNKYYLYDIINGKKIAEYNKKINNLTYSDTNRELLVIEFDDNYEVLKNGKKTFSFTEQEYSDDYEILNNGIVFDIGGYDGYTIVDSSGNIINKNVYDYMDTENYIIRELKDRTTYSNIYKFYSNGKLANTIEIDGKLENVNGVYKVKVETTKEYGYSSSGKYYYGYDYYNAKGEKMNENPFSSGGTFSDSGYAIVKTNESNGEYLVDKTFKKISDTYQKIKKEYVIDENIYYIATKDSVNYLLSADGKEIVSGFDEYGQYNGGDYYYIKLKYGDMIHLYNSKTGKKMVELKETGVKIDDLYAYIEEDDTMTYYSYVTGKPFYTVKTN